MKRRIFPGDTIVVPKAEVVYILGDVNRPGGIAMVTNDSKLSVVQAITLAGGTPPNAVPSHARLIRKQADGSHAEIPLNLSAMQKGKSRTYSCRRMTSSMFHSATRGNSGGRRQLVRATHRQRSIDFS